MACVKQRWGERCSRTATASEVVSARSRQATGAVLAEGAGMVDSGGMGGTAASLHSEVPAV